MEASDKAKMKAHFESFAILLLSFIFFLPLPYFSDSSQRIIEFTILMLLGSTIYIFRKEPINKWIDNSGVVYLLFILICGFFTCVELQKIMFSEDALFLIHIYITTSLSAIVYVITYRNFNCNDDFSITPVVLKLFFAFTILFAAYTAWYGMTLRILSGNSIMESYSFAKDWVDRGYVWNWIGGTSENPLFIFVFVSFWIGYVKAQKRFFLISVLLLTLTMGISYICYSRAGIILTVLLFLFVLFSKLGKKKTFLSLAGTLTVGFVLNSEYSVNLGDRIYEFINMGKVSLFSGRSQLIAEGLLISFRDGFLGRGFHATELDKPLFLNKGFSSLADFNTHNIFINQIIEIGIIGLLFFLIFFIITYRKARMVKKVGKNQSIRGVGSGCQYMVISFALVCPLVPHLEKRLSVFGIIMMLTAIANKLASIGDQDASRGHTFGET
ncbi:MAG: O-antigen ligase family protein [Desulfobacter sp.]|nr:MAG: O-antigen ligase family protein [Desulfobacter sp.]